MTDQSRQDTATLVRVSSDSIATYGVFVYQGTPLCITLELPWIDNEQNKSCIPLGEYVCRRIVSPKHGDTFMVDNVPGRSSIEFHVGNSPSDTNGCILVASTFEAAGYVGASVDGFRKFMARIGHLPTFNLSVQNVVH